jgi:hypothetical protein
VNSTDGDISGIEEFKNEDGEEACFGNEVDEDDDGRRYKHILIIRK